MIWRIENSHCYMCGTIHWLPKNDHTIDPIFRKLQDQVKKVFFEAKPENQKREAMSLAPGTSLKDLISTDLYKSTSSKWQELGVQIKMDSLKPWAVAQIIGELTQTQNGYSWEHGVENQLRNLCNPDQMEYLEEPGNEISIYDPAPHSEHVYLLQESVDSGKYLSILSGMVTAWRKFDLEYYENLLKERLKILPHIHEAMVHKRTRSWFPRILKTISAKEPTLFAVGALHLVGEVGIPNLLKEEGIQTVLLKRKNDNY